MSTYASHLRVAAQKLISVTDVPILEAEILLAHVLKSSRANLYARLNEDMRPAYESEFQRLINRRVAGEPIAYIVGHKEFWSMELMVTPDVLIPRPETELLVELVLSQHDKKKFHRLADLGTGSGAIALAIASECPPWEIYATDVAIDALSLAKRNAEKQHIKNIHFLQGEWCQSLPDLSFDIIVSNPPYLAESDVHLRQGDLRFEPVNALVAADNGFACFEEIIFSACQFLRSKGSLWLEHGYQQAEELRDLMKKAGYQSIETFKDLAGLERVTKGIVF